MSKSPDYTAAVMRIMVAALLGAQMVRDGYLHPDDTLLPQEPEQLGARPDEIIVGFIPIEEGDNGDLEGKGPHDE